jgi:alkanesulfonate monooxygenase SsuD/methylene tetrahydromethanopterin reductase-like flavin-dependent oxidoreductase (luciferase family)
MVEDVGRRPEFHIFLPQMRLDLATLVGRARAAEAAGFDGIALMDHLAPPMALDQPMYDAMVTAAWLAAHTERLTIGHLVLCDSLRHPAVLAKQAVSLDHASGGRFELGIGWGSVPEELATFGVGSVDARVRVRRLAETLEVVRALWSGEPVDFHGEHVDITGGRQRPTPLDRIPIVIGGAGPRTLELVAAHADWWNLPIYAIDRLEELRPGAGRARTSVQEMVTFLPAGGDAAAIEATAARRFGRARGRVTGTAAELADHFGALADRGVERFYCWFSDFADPATLEAFGASVIAPTRDGAGALQAPAHEPM